MGNICMTAEEIEQNKILESYSPDEYAKYNKRIKELLYEEVKKYINKYLQNNFAEFPINQCGKTTCEYFRFVDDIGIKHYKNIHYNDLLHVIKDEMLAQNKKYTVTTRFSSNCSENYPSSFLLVINVIN